MHVYIVTFKKTLSMSKALLVCAWALKQSPNPNDPHQLCRTRLLHVELVPAGYCRVALRMWYPPQARLYRYLHAIWYRCHSMSWSHSHLPTRFLVLNDRMKRVRVPSRLLLQPWPPADKCCIAICCTPAQTVMEMQHNQFFPSARDQKMQQRDGITPARDSDQCGFAR